MEIDNSLTIRLNGTDAQIDLFIKLLPIIQNGQRIGKTGFIGQVDFESAALLYHCKKKYGAIEKNNQINKALARKEAIRLREQGLTLQEIAEWLNYNGYKTSRGKEYSKMQVKRIIDEGNKNK